MHYIQNAWFLVSWYWVLPILFIVGAIAFYIQNNIKRSQKLALVSLLLVVFALYYTFMQDQDVFSSSQTQLKHWLEQQQVESGTLLEKTSEFFPCFYSKRNQ
jgi:hypothetical protein